LQSKENQFKKKTSRELSAKDKKKLDNAKNIARAMTVNELKGILKANDQSSTGNKSELVERVADGVAFGAMPRCSKCSGGRLKIIGGYYVCPGYMEDDVFLSCDFTSTKIERREWKEIE